MNVSSKTTPPFTTLVTPRPPWLAEVIENAAMLLEDRLTLLQSSMLAWRDLIVLDERLDAHLDALRVCSECVWPDLLAKLQEPSPGLLFLGGVLAIERRSTGNLKQLLALAEARIELRPALYAALSWVNPTFTRPLVQPLLASNVPFYWRIALHLLHQDQTRADTVFEWALTQPDPDLQRIALNAVGDIGVMDLLPRCLSLLQSTDDDIRFLAARASVLLGERSQGLRVLKGFAATTCGQQQAALFLLTAVLPVTEAQQFLVDLAKHGCDARLLIRLAGELGGPAQIPALLRLMHNPLLSRLAGHAFCNIVGLDLVESNMESSPPPNLNTGPNDDPDDAETASDPDEVLPWPDVKKVHDWWNQHGSAFDPRRRYLGGIEITRYSCLEILHHGNYGQRHAAAFHLKADDPASALFQLHTPAWRQQRRIAMLQASL